MASEAGVAPEPVLARERLEVAEVPEVGSACCCLRHFGQSCRGDAAWRDCWKGVDTALRLHLKRSILGTGRGRDLSAFVPLWL